MAEAPANLTCPRCRAHLSHPGGDPASAHTMSAGCLVVEGGFHPARVTASRADPPAGSPAERGLVPRHRRLDLPITLMSAAREPVSRYYHGCRPP